jgi:hypothetical protein
MQAISKMQGADAMQIFDAKTRSENQMCKCTFSISHIFVVKFKQAVAFTIKVLQL